MIINTIKVTASYTAQLPQEDENLYSILKEGMRIYIGTFRTPPLESLHVKTYDPSLEGMN